MKCSNFFFKFVSDDNEGNQTDSESYENDDMSNRAEQNSNDFPYNECISEHRSSVRQDLSSDQNYKKVEDYIKNTRKELPDDIVKDPSSGHASADSTLPSSDRSQLRIGQFNYSNDRVEGSEISNCAALSDDLMEIDGKLHHISPSDSPGSVSKSLTSNSSSD